MREQDFRQGERLRQNPNQIQSLGLNQIEKFINTQVVSRGLDERTAKAYRLDLEQFYVWLGAQEEDGSGYSGQPLAAAGKGDKQTFLLVDLGKTEVEEKKAEPGKQIEIEKQGELRKQIGLGKQAELRMGTEPENDKFAEWMEIYLKYLAEERKLRFSTVSRKQRVFRYYLSYLAGQGIVREYRPLKPVKRPKEGLSSEYLTKKEIDLFFQAIQQEYKELDSDFRKRVCLRDQVMMELLFYHRIEISELLRLEVSDYNPRTAVLTVPRKREKERAVYLFSKALQGQMARWLEEHEYFEHDGAYRNRMFLSKLGKPLSMKMVVNIFDKYRVRAGIEKMCTPKDLKNSLGRYAEEVVREMG